MAENDNTEIHTRMRCLEMATSVYGGDANRPPAIVIASAAFVWANFVVAGIDGAIKATESLPGRFEAASSAEAV